MDASYECRFLLSFSYCGQQALIRTVTWRVTMQVKCVMKSYEVLPVLIEPVTNCLLLLTEHRTKTYNFVPHDRSKRWCSFFCVLFRFV